MIIIKQRLWVTVNMKLTKKNIEALEPREIKYVTMFDGQENFGVMTYPSSKDHPSGIKKYCVRIRFGNSKKQKIIGNCKHFSIPDAKDRADEIIKQYKNGIDVTKEEKKKQVNNKTLQSCIDEYLPTVKPRTQTDIKKCMKTWDKWLKKPLRNITPAMVLRQYDKRVKISFHRARLESAYLRSLWNHYKKELNLTESPTIILNQDRKGWSKRTINHRRLDHETAKEFLPAISNLTSDRDASLFKLIYFTGLRASEAMNLTWENINLDNNSLHIADTKNGDPLDIPLNSHAITVITEIADGEFKHKKYLFPQVSRKGEISEMKSYAKSLATLQKTVLWSPHDSRRGFINAGGVVGSNSYMVKQLVNHVDNSEAHAGYNHYTVGELRNTSQAIGDFLNNQLHSDNVIELKTRMANS